MKSTTWLKLTNALEAERFSTCLPANGVLGAAR